MRSIDDIIDKLDTSSVDGGPDQRDSQSPTVRSSTQQQADVGDQDSPHADTVTDDKPREVRSGGGMLPTEMKSQTVLADDARRRTFGSEGTVSLSTSQDLRLQQRRSTSASPVSPSSEPLWQMFGAPLSQLCRRLLTEVHEQRPTDVAKTELVEPRLTGQTESTETTGVSKNLRQSAEVQSAHASRDVQLLGASRVGVVQPNGRASLTEGHKPPLPIKPSLPPKPPIPKKPSFSKETSAGIVRKSSSLSSPPCSSVVPQQQTRSQGSDGPPTTINSAPTSPTVGVIQRHASQQQQQQPQQPQQQVMVRRTTSDVTCSADHTSAPPHVIEKTKLATTARDAAGRRSPARERMKTTKSEEFLARIHRRSVSPVGTPRLMARSSRGNSVDLSAPSDTATPIGRRTLSREWAVVTTTTQEEVTVVYRPPTTSAAPEIVCEDTPTVTSSTGGVIKREATVNNNVVERSSGRLYKTAIDNIRLSVNVGGNSTSKHRAADGSDVGVGEAEHVHGDGGRECQLDELISSLIEISADNEGAQPQLASVRRGVISTAHY